MEAPTTSTQGITTTEHALIVRNYEAAVPLMKAIFGEIPILWATAANGLAAAPVYHENLDTGPATIQTASAA